MAAADVPAETRLLTQEFKLAGPGEPYTSPTTGAWSQARPETRTVHGQARRRFRGDLLLVPLCRSAVLPAIAWSEEKKAKLQAFVEKLHANWPIDRDYMAPPSRGELVTLDPALLVTPPKGLEVGYVPIVTRQSAQ